MTVDGGIVLGPRWNENEPSFEGYFASWRKLQSTMSFVVECDDAKFEAVKAAIKASWRARAKVSAFGTIIARVDQPTPAQVKSAGKAVKLSQSEARCWSHRRRSARCVHGRATRLKSVGPAIAPSRLRPERCSYC